MKKSQAILIFAIALAAAMSMACASPSPKISQGSTIAYVKVDSLYMTLLKDSEEARALFQTEKELRRNLEKVRKGGALSAMERKREGELVKKLQRLQERKGELKKEILTRIEGAVEEVASREGADLVLNYGEGLVYGKKSFDITREVLRELLQQERRSAPVSQ